MIKVIGVTGGVGTGKSTITRLFKEHGAVLFDADHITHGLMKPRTAVWKKIVKKFGKRIVTRSGAIDRAALARIVFGSRRELRKLTGIIHPAVRRRIQEGIATLARRKKNGLAVLDIPLLLESDYRYRVDAVVVVTASRRAVAKRLRKRSNWGIEEIEKRGRFQMPLARKVKKADFVVTNSGPRALARGQVRRIWKQVAGVNKKGEGE